MKQVLWMGLAMILLLPSVGFAHYWRYAYRDYYYAGPYVYYSPYSYYRTYRPYPYPYYPYGYYRPYRYWYGW